VRNLQKARNVSKKKAKEGKARQSEEKKKGKANKLGNVTPRCRRRREEAGENNTRGVQIMHKVATTRSRIDKRVKNWGEKERDGKSYWNLERYGEKNKIKEENMTWRSGRCYMKVTKRTEKADKNEISRGE